MAYRILKHVSSERVETLCGCRRYFWFTICSWDRRGREKKQRDSKFLALASLLTTKNKSLFMEFDAVFSTRNWIFVWDLEKYRTYCILPNFLPIELSMLELSLAVCILSVLRWFVSSFLDNFGVFWTLQNCFNSALLQSCLKWWFVVLFFWPFLVGFGHFSELF